MSSRELRAQRLAQRVEVAGRMIHLDAPHGTASGYIHYGCQCSDCREALRTDRKRRTDARKRERIEDIDGRMIHPDAPHGTNEGYDRYLCRCERCDQVKGRV